MTIANEQHQLSPEQYAQIAGLTNQRQRIKGDYIFIEESPRFDLYEKPTPIPERTGPGWCGKDDCPYAHVVVEPHEWARARDRASATHRDEVGVSRRYHVDIHITESWLIDARSARNILSVAALEAKDPAALAAVRILRHANADLLYISVTPTGTHAKLLIFSEEFGVGIKIVDERIVDHRSGAGGSARRSQTGARATVTLRRLRRASLRAKIGAIFFEALLVYACGELAALLLGHGGHLLSDQVTLPVWLLATPLILLGTAVKWLAWRQLRPSLHTIGQRLTTLYRRKAERTAAWFANLDAEAIRRKHDEPRLDRPKLPWQQSHLGIDGTTANAMHADSGLGK
jgi:hypothetical protein